MWPLFLEITAWAIPIVMAVILHEVAHGWVAEKLGDPTARLMGRITLNPVRHIDPVGTIMFPAVLLLANSPVIFGAAKPVPVNFGILRPHRLGIALVALAGPLTNIALALLHALALHLDKLMTPEQYPWLFTVLYRGLMINCVLACFNLIPFLPLDGGRVVSAFLPESLRRRWMRLEKASLLLLLAALLLPTLMGMDMVQTVLLTPTMWLLEIIMQLTGNST